MLQDQDMIKCWEYFECTKRKCPAYGSKNYHCWLIESTFCNDQVNSAWFEKMELCLNCMVFQHNLSKGDLEQTFQTINRQFVDYKKQLDKNQIKIKKTQKKLEEFKKTSIYLLRELDKKSQEIQAERDKLEIGYQERTDELNSVHEKLMQTEKMAAIGRLSAGIAHEINNPLGAIINYIRSLAANPEIAGQSRGYVELIAKGLFRIENIIKQILNYAGNQKANPKLSNVNLLIHEAIAFSHMKKDKNVAVEFLLKENLPEIFVDPFQLQQVFVNIINNALDAMDHQGRLIIKTSCTVDNVEIIFKDTGKGIDKEEVSKVFDPFYTTKEVGRGSGLGLFMSYNIIQVYRGDIEIKSQKGKGTTVIVRLPVYKKK